MAEHEQCGRKSAIAYIKGNMHDGRCVHEIKMADTRPPKVPGQEEKGR